MHQPGQLLVGVLTGPDAHLQGIQSEVGSSRRRKPGEISGSTPPQVAAEYAAVHPHPPASRGSVCGHRAVTNARGPLDPKIERASDAKIPCGIFASHGEPEGL